MARLGPLTNAAVKLGSTDFSDHVTDVTVNLSAAENDVTAMGSAGMRRAAGLRDDSFDLTLLSDYASGSVDAFLQAQVAGGSLFLVEVWANGTATSATNPKYSATCICTEFNPISGSVGDTALSSVKLLADNLITRATA